jgi:outer membrane phospholipase A
MMGPVSVGSSGTIDEIKAILSMVSDPQKVKASLEEMSKILQETKKLLDEKSQVETAVEMRLKEEAVVREQNEKMIAAVKLEQDHLSTKSKVYADNMKELEAKKSSFEKEQAAFLEMKAKFLADMDRREVVVGVREKEAKEKMAFAKALEEEFLTKQENLKKLMGV